MVFHRDNSALMIFDLFLVLLYQKYIKILGDEGVWSKLDTFTITIYSINDGIPIIGRPTVTNTTLRNNYKQIFIIVHVD